MLENYYTRPRPMHYKRDGTPIIGTPAYPDWLQFAELMENKEYQRVEVSYTLYGERLSTAWLGIDHNFSDAPDAIPIIFETMLFAPVRREDRRAALHGKAPLKHRILTKLYPHDGRFQLRYATEAEARAGHRRAKLQCLIPPLLRRPILYWLGRDETWN